MADIVYSKITQALLLLIYTTIASTKSKTPVSYNIISMNTYNSTMLIIIACLAELVHICHIICEFNGILIHDDVIFNLLINGYR